MQPFFREFERDPTFVSEQARHLADRWVRRGLRPTAEQRDFIQRVLFSGLACLPGQRDLFPTDGKPERERRLTMHTPGPWIAGELKDREVGSPTIPIIAHGLWIADVLSGQLRTGELNARLIAAAPELLAALDRLLACPALAFEDPECIERQEDIDAIAEAIAAISQATKG